MATDPKRVKEIFLAAAEFSNEADRARHLDGACAGDAELRARVEALLESHDSDGSLLDNPAVQVPMLREADTEALSIKPGAKAPAGQTIDGEGGAAPEESLAFLGPPTRPDSLGRLGHYEVLQVLGKGGFGIVFRAFDDTLQRVVALKVLAPQLAATSPARKRFLREARSSAQVRHDNVVQVYEIGEQPLPYLAMEFIPGETLQQRLDRVGPVDPAEVVRVGRQIAEGLAAAHATDLIHRDIKPGNILLEGGQHKVKITDFGLARAADDASISQSGIIAGTPMYMAPEQAKGDKLDQRADLFSLGSVLYQMASGRPPFRANSAVAVLKRVADDLPRDIREVIPETPQWLCDIIAKLHAKNPEERFQSAREVADLLADCEAQLKVNAKLKDLSRIPVVKAHGSGKAKWIAAAAVVMAPLFMLAVTESAGLTHLFSQQKPANPVNPGGDFQIAKPPIAPAPFTDADVKRIAALPAHQQVEHVCKELKHRNPDFDGNAEHEIEDDVVAQFKIVTNKITDISPIRGLVGLRKLKAEPDNATPNGGVSDLSPLKGMALSELTIRRNKIDDLTPLKGMPLKLLWIDTNPIKSLKALEGLSLEYLSCIGLPVADLTPLQGMRLKILTLHATNVSDLSPLKGMPLEELNINRTEVANLSPLMEMPLGDLNIAQTRVADISPLRGVLLRKITCDFNAGRDTVILRSIKTLETINGKPAEVYLKQAESAIQENFEWIAKLPATQQVVEIGKELKRRNPEFDGALMPTYAEDRVIGLEFSAHRVADISPLRALVHLRVLTCRGDGIKPGMISNLAPLKNLSLEDLTLSVNPVMDLTPLKGMPLRTLHVDNSNIFDLSPLEGMPLKVLNCSYTKISSLDPLKKMPLEIIWCNHTEISDLTPVKGMSLQWITIQNTKVNNLSPLKGMPLTQIYLDFNPKRDGAFLSSFPTLQKINDKAADEFLKSNEK